MPPPRPLDQDLLQRLMSLSPNLPGITTGNPSIDMVVSLLMGQGGFAPRPTQGQSIYESYLQRDRSNQFLSTMNQGLNQMPVIQKLGGLDLSSGPAQFLAPFINRPGGLADNAIMRAMNAGNPIAAQMSMLSRGTGLTAANMTGNFQNLSVADTTKMMEGLNTALFHRRKVTQDDADDVNRDIDLKIKRRVASRAAELPATELATEMRDLKDALARDNIASQKLGLYDQQGKFDFTKFGALETAPGAIDTTKLQGAGQEVTDALKKLSTQIKDKTADVIQPLETAKRDMAAKVGKADIIRGVNVQATRGFETQDLSKSMMMGVDLGMINYKQDFQKNLAQLKSTRPDLAPDELRSEAHKLTTQTTMGNLGKVMRAGADLFGTETAAETTAMVNELFGISKLNLNDTKDADYATNLMRRIRSTARVTGISTEEVMRAQSTAMSLAQGQLGQKYIGGAETMEGTTLQTIREAHVMAANMGSQRIRELGGMSAFVQSELESKALVSDQSARVMGMLGFIDNNASLSAQQKLNLRTKIISATENQTLDAPGLQRLTDELANTSGGAFNAVQLQQAQTSDQFVSAGFARNEELRKAGQATINQDKIVSNFFDTRLKMDIADRLANKGPITVKDLDQQGQVITRQLSTTDEAMDYYNSLYDLDKAEQLGYGRREEMFAFSALGVQSPALEQMFRGKQGQALLAAKRRTAILATPEGQKKLQEMAAQVASQAKAEEAMAQNLAHLQQPLGQSIAQMLINGQFSEGVAPLMQVLQNPTGIDALQTTSGAVSRMNTLQTADSRTSTFLAATGGAGNNFKQKLQQLNFTPAQIQTIEQQRGYYTSNQAGLAALNQVVDAGAITVNELETFARLSAADYAQTDYANTPGALTHAQITAANMFAQETGLLDYQTAAKYKNIKLDKKSMARIYQDYAANRSLELAQNNSLSQQTLTNNETVLKAALADPSVTPALTAEIMQRFGKNGSLDIERIGQAFADVKSGKLDSKTVKNIETLGLTDAQGELDVNKYYDAITTGGSQEAIELREAAQQTGLLTTTATGAYEMTAANRAKAKQQLSSYYGMQELEKAGISSNAGAGTMGGNAYNTLSSLGELITKVQETIDTAKQSTGTADQQKPLIDLKDAIDKGIADLSTVIKEVSMALTGLMKP